MQQYQLTRRIGYGGMGRIFEARKLTRLDTDDIRRVAVKLVPARETAEDEEQAVMLFEREAKLSWLHSHDHPNLLTTYDYGETSKGCRYLIMEFLDGESLRDLTREQPLLPYHVIRRVARDVLLGLAHLHKREVLHRDVSPRNIMISHTGVTKVIDFGLAKGTNQSGSKWGRGTPGYSSPEAMEGKDLSPMADLYSLGAVLYEVVTGKCPYGSSLLEIQAAVLENKEVPRLPAGTPDDIAALIEGLIPLSPVDRRWRFANDVIAFLDECGQPIANDDVVTDVVDNRSNTRQKISPVDVSLPKIGFPFEDLSLPNLARSPEPVQEPESRQVRPVARNWRRWLPWALIPIAFVAGLMALVLIGDTSSQPSDDASDILESSANDTAGATTTPTKATRSQGNEIETMQTSASRATAQDPYASPMDTTVSDEIDSTTQNGDATHRKRLEASKTTKRNGYVTREYSPF